ncbi:MAG: dTDP-4-dehydrorhamnose reductase, partial [Sneathiella sp.]|nr:dTDP-4-dehydrorhamnose reductase [Sneathiella sp.]
VKAAFNKYTPDVVINAAAYTAVDKAEEEQDTAYAVNRDGPEILAAACSITDIPFLHISTDFVFDGNKKEPYSEKDKCNPLSIYGKSKWEGEKALIAKCTKHIILRTAWVFGGDQNFVKTMRRLAETRDVLSVVNDQRGGPTAALDIAASLIRIAKAVVSSNFSDWGIYHYCGNPSVSWYEFACEILKNKPSVTVKPIPTSSYPTPAMRPANSVLACEKIRTVFGISQPDWTAALSQ